MTATVLIYRAIFSFFGMREYLPYACVSIGIHLVVVWLGFLLLRRASCPPWVAALTAALVLINAAGSSLAMWSIGIALMGGLACGLGAVLILQSAEDRDSVRLAWLVLCLGLTFSGTGITAVGLAASFAYVTSGAARALKVISVPLIVYLVWFFTYGQIGKAHFSTAGEYLGISKLIWTGLTSPLESATGIPGAGAPLFLLLVGALIKGTAVPAPLRDLGLAGLMGAVIQLSLAAITRPLFGADFSSAGRYGYITMVLLAPGIAASLIWISTSVTRGMRGWSLLGAIACVLMLALGAHSVATTGDNARFLTGSNPGLLRGVVKATQAGERILTMQEIPGEIVNSRFRPDLVADQAAWKAIPRGEATAAERLLAESLYYVSVQAEEELAVPLASRAELGSAWKRPGALKSGCSNHRTSEQGAQLALASYGGGAQVGIFGPSAKVTTRLERDGTQGVARDWEVQPMETFFVGTSTNGTVLRITLDKPGKYYICLAG